MCGDGAKAGGVGPEVDPTVGAERGETILSRLENQGRRTSEDKRLVVLEGDA